MGQMAGNIEVKNHNPDNLFIGNNKFVSGTVKLAASGTAKDGYVLTHDLTNNVWEVATASTIDDGLPMGILATRDDIVNTDSSNPASFAGQRICIAGDVNKNLSSIGGTGLTDVQGEYLRVQEIYNIDAKQIGTFDNQ